MNAKSWKREKKWNSGHDSHRRKVREDQGGKKYKEFVVLLEEPGIVLVERKYPECKQKRETWRERKESNVHGGKVRLEKSCFTTRCMCFLGQEKLHHPKIPEDTEPTNKPQGVPG